MANREYGRGNHGGCIGCNQPPSICKQCMYMKGEWYRPNMWGRQPKPVVNKIDPNRAFRDRNRGG